MFRSGFKCTYTCTEIMSHEWMHYLSFHQTFNCMKRYKYSLQTALRICKKRGNIGGGWRRWRFGGSGTATTRGAAKFNSLCFVIIQCATKILLKQNMCKEYLFETQSCLTHIDSTIYHSRWHFHLVFISCYVVDCSRFKFIGLNLHIVLFFGEWMWENARFWLCDIKPMLTKWE